MEDSTKSDLPVPKITIPEPELPRSIDAWSMDDIAKLKSFHEIRNQNLDIEDKRKRERADSEADRRRKDAKHALELRQEKLHGHVEIAVMFLFAIILGCILVWSGGVIKDSNAKPELKHMAIGIWASVASGSLAFWAGKRRKKNEDN